MSLAIIDMVGLHHSPPRINAFTRHFWQNLSIGLFETTRCRVCRAVSFPPKAWCAKCSGRDVEWISLSGDGLLYSLTTVHAGPPALMRDGPYSGAIIDTAEGVRLIAPWLGPHDTALDAKIELVVTRYENGSFFAARPKS